MTNPTSDTSPTSPPQPPAANNPFYLGLDGLKLFFTLAQSVAIFTVVLAGLAFLLNTFSRPFAQMQDPDPIKGNIMTGLSIDPNLALAIVLFSIPIILLTMYIKGIMDYTAAQLWRGQRTTLGDTMIAVWQRFPGYLWTELIAGVKVLLWTLLLIVPGFIMSIRYNLTGVVFFAEGKRGHAASKESAAITKGAWFTTFGAFALWNLMTFGLMEPVLESGTKAKLYALLAGTAGQQKPRPHWASILVFALVMAMFAIGVIGALFFVYILFSLPGLMQP